MFGIKGLKEEVNELRFEVYKLANQRKYKNGDVVWVECYTNQELTKTEKKEYVICDYIFKERNYSWTTNSYYSYYELIDCEDLSIKTTTTAHNGWITGLSKRKIQIK